MAFAIMRCKKLKGLGSVASSLKHAYRERETPNADPKLTPSNGLELSRSTDEAMVLIRNRLPEKRRKDAVLAVEYLMTASPEWWKTASPKAQEMFFQRSVEWLKQKYGADNLAALVIHRDETSPHLSAFVVPVTKNGRLTAKEFIGNKTKMSKDQSSFAAAVADLGLQRGIEGSKAKHQTIRQYYARVAEGSTPVISGSDVEPQQYKNGLLGMFGMVTATETSDSVADRVNRKLAPVIASASMAAQERRRADSRTQDALRLRDVAKAAIDAKEELERRMKNANNEKPYALCEQGSDSRSAGLKAKVIRSVDLVPCDEPDKFYIGPSRTDVYVAGINCTTEQFLYWFLGSHHGENCLEISGGGFTDIGGCRLDFSPGAVLTISFDEWLDHRIQEWESFSRGQIERMYETAKSKIAARDK